MRKSQGWLGRGARMVGAAALAVPILVQPTTSPAAMESPVAEIVNPENSKIFRPGDVPLVDGNAFAGLGVHAVKLEFWLLNRLERQVLAQCTACTTSTASYWTYSADGLTPGYYVVKAYAVDNAGNFSPAAQRGFVYGLHTVATPTPPTTPNVPLPPGTIPPPTVEVPQGPPLPGATGPVTIGGQTAEPGQTVRVREQTLGPLGMSRSDEDGAWTFSTRLPTGVYKFRVRAHDREGRSPWSRIYTIAVDADRPLLGVTTPADTVFLPTQPAVLEGTLFDEQAPAKIRLQYWLLDDVVLTQELRCPACSQQEFVWQHRPQGLSPGYYVVRISAYDASGNPSHNASTSFVYALA